MRFCTAHISIHEDYGFTDGGTRTLLFTSLHQQGYVQHLILVWTDALERTLVRYFDLQHFTAVKLESEATPYGGPKRPLARNDNFSMATTIFGLQQWKKQLGFRVTPATILQFAAYSEGP